MNRSIFFHIPALAFILLINGQLFSQSLNGNYSINPGPTGDYSSFSAAVSDLVNNGVSGQVSFLIEPGTYTEQISIPAIAGASAQNTISFVGNANDSLSVVLSFAQTAFASNYVIRLDGADYINFSKMTIQSTGFIYNRVIVLENQADYNSFSNCHIIGQPATGYYTDNAVIYSANTRDQHNLFSNNSILNGSYAMYLYSTNYNDEYYNQIISNYITGFYAYGIKMEYQYGAEVSGNILISAAQCHTYLYGIYLRYADGPSRISENKIEVQGSDDMRGITTQYCNGSSLYPVLIANNFVMETGSSSDKSWGMFIYHGMHQHIFHNSVWVSSGSASGSRAMYFTTYGSSSTGNNQIKNNIAVNTAGGPAIHVSYGSFSDNQISECDYNNWYATGTYIGKYKDIGETSLSDWQTETGWDANSFNLDPLYAGPSDLHTGNMALNGTGTPLSEVSIDIDNEPRDSIAPDIGADEFGLPGPLNGSYVIDVNGTGDYLSFSDAIGSLALLGVDGPVVFNIFPGTYLEKPDFPEITGTSNNNTITFQSTNGDSLSVILTNNSSTYSENYTLKIDGADHIRFKNLSITTDVGWSYCRLVEIGNNSTHLSFENCIFQGIDYNSNSTNYCLVYSDGGNDDFCSFINNHFVGGSNSIYLKGSSQFYPEEGLQIIDNEIIDFSYRGILIQYAENALIEGNNVISNLSADTYNYVYGIYASFCDGSNTISKNNVLIYGYNKNYGLYLNYCDGQAGSPFIADNNMISISGSSTGTVYGIHSFSGNHQQIYFNSVLIACGNSGSAAFYVSALSNGTYSNVDVRNNIFANSNGGYASYINNLALSAGYITASDYNNYFYTGANMAKFGNFDAPDLATWQMMSGWGTNSVEGNPLFYADTNLHVQSGSSAMAAGVSIPGFSFDIDLDNRDAISPCIGADEFIVPVPLVDTQLVLVSQGWSIFSTYIDIIEPHLDSIFAQVIGDVIIIKNGNGNIFWPQFGVNSIGNMVLGEGYQIKTVQAIIVQFEGNTAIPETITIPVPVNWSIIGYLRTSQGLTPDMLTSLGYLVVIVKDGDGLIYWPQYGLNQIGNMMPGKGYQIKLSGSGNLIYPAN